MSKKKPVSRRAEHETLEALAKALAQFTAGNSAMKSIRLQMGDDTAKEWAAVRSAARVNGYITVPEAEDHFLRLFGFHVERA